MTEITPRERWALSAPPPPEAWYDNYPAPTSRPVYPSCMYSSKPHTAEERRQVEEYLTAKNKWEMDMNAAAAAAWAWAYADAVMEARHA